MNDPCGKKHPQRSAGTFSLISDPVNIFYLTGFLGAQPAEHEAYLLRSAGKMHLLTNSLYIERARKLAGIHPDLTVVRISRSRGFDQAVKTILTAGSARKLFYEADHLSVCEFERLRRAVGHRVSLEPAQSDAETNRMIKTEAEIAKIRKAVRITDACFNAILKWVKPGISERELAFRIEYIIRKKGADTAFAPIVSFDGHASQPHYIPDDTTLKDNTPVLMDFGAKADGYCADMTRVVSCGVPDRRVIRAHRVIRKARDLAIRYLSQKKEVSGAEADRRTKSYIRSKGLPPYSHSLGHAVGLEIHEAPKLTATMDAPIRPGMVFSVEPGTYLPGKFGVRIEDLVLKTENGLEVLTKSPLELIIL